MTRILHVIACLALLTGSNLPTMKYRALDDDGDPISGGKLYSYEAGTSTPLATYSDQALNSANANPVVADGDGWFGEIYCDPDEQYKFVMKDASDVIIFTVDDIYCTALEGSSISDRLKQVASNPLDYGAIGDGVADEYGDVQDAIDAATGVVDLLGKTFRCDSKVTLASDLVIKNGTLDFSSCTDSYCLSSAGTVGTTYTVDADITAGDTSFDLTSVSGISAGDWLKLTSTADYVSGDGDAQEFVRVESVSSPTVTTTHPIQNSYTTANAASVYAYTFVDNLILKNVHIISPTSDVALQLTNSSNIKIQDCEFTDSGSHSIYISNSVNVLVENTKFVTQNTTTGNGLYITGPSRNITVDGCLFDTLDHGLELDGNPARYVTVKNSTFNGVDGGVYIMSSVEDLDIINNVFAGDVQISGDSTSYATVAANIRIIGNRFTGGTTAIDLDSLNTIVDSNITIKGNLLEVGDIDIAELAASTGDVVSLDISNNVLVLDGIQINASAGTGSYERIILDGNIMSGTPITMTGEGTISTTITNNKMRVAESSATDLCVLYVDEPGDVIVSGNEIYGDNTDNDNGICLFSTGTNVKATIFGNKVDNLAGTGTTSGIYAEGFGYLTIESNTINDAATGISLVTSTTDGIDNAAVSGNILSSVTTGIYLEAQDTVNVTNLNITNNVVGTSSDIAIDLDCSGDGTCTYINIIGNILRRDDDTDDNIHLAGAAGHTMSNVTIIGNFIENGAYGIGEEDDANVTSVYSYDNVFSGIGTAETEFFGAGWVSHVDVTDTYTMTYGDCNKTVMVTEGIDTKSITLPATVEDCTYTFVYTGADGGALVDISPDASDAIHGSCTLAASVVTFSGADGADIGLTKATADTGDHIRLTGDGSVGWYVTECEGIWANN